MTNLTNLHNTTNVQELGHKVANLRAAIAAHAAAYATASAANLANIANPSPEGAERFRRAVRVERDARDAERDALEALTGVYGDLPECDRPECGRGYWEKKAQAEYFESLAELETKIEAALEESAAPVEAEETEGATPVEAEEAVGGPQTAQNTESDPEAREASESPANDRTEAHAPHCDTCERARADAAVANLRAAMAAAGYPLDLRPHTTRADVIRLIRAGAEEAERYSEQLRDRVYTLRKQHNEMVDLVRRYPTGADMSSALRAVRAKLRYAEGLRDIAERQ